MGGIGTIRPVRVDDYMIGGLGYICGIITGLSDRMLLLPKLHIAGCYVIFVKAFRKQFRSHFLGPVCKATSLLTYRHLYDIPFMKEVHELGFCELLLDALAMNLEDGAVTAILNSIFAILTYQPARATFAGLNLHDKILLIKEQATARSNTAIVDLCVSVVRRLEEN